MNTPDQGIPSNLLESAKCIAIIPGDKKFAFVFGGSYGRGLATCRTEHGWSAPMFIAVDGGSVGYQIGGSSNAEILSYTRSKGVFIGVSLDGAVAQADKSGEAFGRPGIPPRWTSNSKECLGTAYSTSSRVWFTISHGIRDEIYFPTIDHPQTRDMQFLITSPEFVETPLITLERTPSVDAQTTMRDRCTNGPIASRVFATST